MIRPIITEKSMGLAGRGWYTFAVDKHSRKETIAYDVAAMYHVDVLTVRTVAMHGKVRRTGKKMTSTHRADWKKAIVQLKSGQKIDAFEVTSQLPSTPADAKAMAGKETSHTDETGVNEEKKLETQEKGKVKK